MSRLGGILRGCISGYLMALLLVSGAATAGVQEGAQWLSQQTLSNGGVAGELESSAAVLQARAESATALMTLQVLGNGIPLLDGSETDTESLARYALWLKSNGLSATGVQQGLLARQGADGGFGHVAGWQSDPVDTALVLLALSDLPYGAAQEAALEYLLQDGLIDVSYADARQRKLAEYYTLSALTVYLPKKEGRAGFAADRVTALEQSQITPGQWISSSSDYFIDALLNGLLHLYRLDTTAATNFKARVLGLQQSNGSWENDPYVTAIVIRALSEVGQPAVSPLRSAFSLSLIDSETGVPLSGVSLISLIPESAGSLALLSDASGSVTQNDLAPGFYKLTLSGIGYLPVVLEANFKSGQLKSFGAVKLSRLEGSSAAVLSGVVTDITSGLPIANALVTVASTGQSARTAADGKFQIVFSAAGNYSVELSSPSYEVLHQQISVVAGSATDVPLRMLSSSVASGGLFGRVVDASGVPLASVAVSYGSHDLETYRLVGTTDSNGILNVAQVALGEYQLAFNKEQYVAPVINTVIPAGGMVDIGTIVMQTTTAGLSTGTIKVSAFNSSTGVLIRHINALAEQIDSSGNVVQRQAYSDFTESNLVLPTGAWRITVTHPSYNQASVSYSLSQGQIINPSLYMSLKPYGLSGTVIDSQSNQALGGVSVRVLRTDNGSQIAATTTSAGGAFQFGGLNLTAVKVEVSPLKHLSTTRWFDRESLTDASPALGDIRVRPLSASELLPDLLVKEISTTSLSTNIQTLSVAGSLGVKISNKGITAVAAQSNVRISAFIDENRNRTLDSSEPVIGVLDNSAAIAAGQVLTVQIPVSGKTLFRDAPIGVWVDAERSVSEAKEDNNILFTSDDVEIAPLGLDLEGDVVWSNKTIISGTHAVAAPLRDTNGDGKIGAGDVADIAVMRVWSDFVVLNGETGAVLWTSGECMRSWYSPSIADLDKDGIPEVVVACYHQSTGVIGVDVYSNTGQLIKRLNSYNTNYGLPYTDAARFFDVDGDGVSEIIVGNHIFNYVTSGWTHSSGCATHMLADMDGDGVPEIISDTGICDINGNLKYSRPSVSTDFQSMAVGDVFGLGSPQIIQSFYAITIDDNKGRRLARYPMAGETGVPTIADYDGDGQADIGMRINNGSVYAVFRADGSMIWSVPIDASGNYGTLMPAFDFDGDGSFDAVVQTRTKLYVFDGPTGAIRLQLGTDGGLGSGVIVVDADADGHADILLPSSSSATGFRMISGRKKDWPATRNIWNENQYRITGIKDDLTVPAREPSFWKTHNTFRANALLDRSSTAASDATASYIRVADGGLISPASFTVRIGNGGGKELPTAMPVSFWRGNPAEGGVYLGTTLTTKALPSGDYEEVVYAYSGSLVSFGELYVVANETAARQRQFVEVARDNNTAHLAIVDGFGGVTLSVATDKAAYAAQENAGLTATLANLGSFSATRDVQLTIIDASGNVVATLPLLSVTAAASESGSGVHSWNTGVLHAGVYGVRADVLYGGQVIATSSSAFTVQGNAAPGQALTSTVVTNRVAYSGLDQVQITARLINPSPNQVYENLVLSTRVTGPAGQVIWTQPDALVQVQPQDLRDQNYTLPLQNAAPGNYQVAYEVKSASGDVLTSANGSFAVISSAVSGQGVTGQLQLPASIVRGESVLINWTLRNQGNAAITALPARIAIINPQSGALETVVSPESLAIAQNAVQQRNVSWTASLATDGSHIALLQVELAGQWQTKAQQVFAIVKPLVTASIATALPDYRVGETLLVTALANNQSPIKLVSAQGVLRIYTPAGLLWYELRSNHQEWLAGSQWPLTLSRVLTLAPAGAWRAEVTVEDAAGNVLSTASTPFNVLSSLLDGAGLSGGLTATPADVEVGQAVAISWQIQNAGNADFTALPLRIVLRKVGATADEQSAVVTVAQLIQGQAGNGLRSFTPTGLADSGYTAALSVQVGAQWRQLAESSFRMKAAASTGTVEVTPAIGSRSRLLVYYSCQSGWHTGLLGWILGQHNAPCFAQREQVLRNYLNQTGTPYQLVKDEDAFVRALRSGEYNNYWLVGAVETLSPSLVAEVTEAINRGDSLLVDGGVQSWLNYDLIELAGVSYRGRLGFTDSRLHLDAPVFTEAHRALNLHTLLTPLFFKVNRGDVTAWWDAQYCNSIIRDWDHSQSQDTSFYNQSRTRYPAMVSSTYGKGRTLALAFDFVGSLQNTAETPQWLAVVGDSLVYTMPVVQNRKRLPGEVVTFNFPIRNSNAAALAVEAELTLPAGARYLGANAVGTVLANGHVRWTFSVPAAGLQDLKLDLQVPTVRGSYNVELAVRPQGSSAEPQRFTQALEVDDALETRITRIRQQIESLPLTSFSDRSLRTQALLRYQQAQLAFNFRLTSTALGHWVATAGMLGDIGHASAAPARIELDLLIKELEARWASAN